MQDQELQAVDMLSPFQTHQRRRSQEALTLRTVLEQPLDCPMWFGLSAVDRVSRWGVMFDLMAALIMMVGRVLFTEDLVQNSLFQVIVSSISVSVASLGVYAVYLVCLTFVKLIG